LTRSIAVVRYCAPTERLVFGARMGLFWPGSPGQKGLEGDLSVWHASVFEN